MKSKLKYAKQTYRGSGFSVSLEPAFRELLRLVHSRAGIETRLDGQMIGEKWETASVHIPKALDASKMSEVLKDLEEAFQAWGHGLEFSYQRTARKVTIASVKLPCAHAKPKVRF